MSNAPLLPDDNDWPSDAAQRLRALFPNLGARETAWPMARSHRHAIQYLEQAPALIAFVTWGAQPRTGSDRRLMAQRFGSATYREPRLKDMMRAFGAPLPIRKICGAAVIPSNYKTILALRKVPPSTLSQAIPERPGAQMLWLRALRRFHDRFVSRMAHRDTAEIWAWAVKAIGAAAIEGVPGVTTSIDEIIDMLVNAPDRFNAVLSFAGALAAADRWHKELAARQNEERFLRQYGIEFDHQIDYAPLSNEGQVGGLTFTALRSGLDLFEEGRAMRHCVGVYIRDVLLGSSRIYSITSNGARVATLELSPAPGGRYALAQVKAHCNGKPSAPVLRATEDFIRTENERIAAERRARRRTLKPREFWIGDKRYDCE